MPTTGHDAHPPAPSLEQRTRTPPGPSHGGHLSTSWSTGTFSWIVEDFTYNDKNQALTSRDGRTSTGDVDLVEFTYDALGNVKTKKWPALNPIDPATLQPYSPAAPLTLQWNYTTGNETAIGGGNAPKGLLRHEYDGFGVAIYYEYNSKGDLMKVTSRSGSVTTYTYDGIGRRLTETITCSNCSVASGQTTTTTYNGLGQVLTVTGPVVDDTTSSDPNHWHRAKTTNVYDANGLLASTTVSDLNTTSSGDAPRATSYSYDENGRRLTVTEPAVSYQGSMVSPVSSTEYDNVGNVVRVVDQQGRAFRTEYDYANRPLRQILEDYQPPLFGAPFDLIISETVYDSVGRPLYEGNARSQIPGSSASWTANPEAAVRVIRHDWFDNGWEDQTWLLNYRPDGATGAGTDILLADRNYDGAGNITGETSAGGLYTTTTFDPANRVTSRVSDPSGIAATTDYLVDANGNVLRQRTHRGGSYDERRFVFDSANNTTATIVEMQNDGATDCTTDLVTVSSYDQLGNMLATTPPRGVSGTAGNCVANSAYTTTYTTDAARRTVATTSPPAPQIAVSATGAVTGPTTTAMVTKTAYDTFGSVRKLVGSDGSVTETQYDAHGRRTKLIHPPYSTPAGVATTTPNCGGTGVVCERFEYDKVGNLLKQFDRRGEAFTYTYDQFNRVSVETDPIASHLVGGVATSSAATAYHIYDGAGNETLTIDRSGAQTVTLFDDRNQVYRTDATIRATAVDPARNAITTYTYDDAGRVLEAAGSNGQIRETEYNVIGEVIKSFPFQNTDPTLYTYDFAGRPKRTTDPSGRYSEAIYDKAGRVTESRQYSSAGVLLATAKSEYDRDGNVTKSYTPVGAAASTPYGTGVTYDVLGRPTQITEPTGTVDQASTMVTSFDYNNRGLLTRVTDGRGNATLITANVWGLEEHRIEPSTTGQTTIDHRRYTTSYDAAGAVVRYDQPTGNAAAPVRQDFVYDVLGRLKQITGSGAEAGTATKLFEYDPAGRQVRASSPIGNTNIDIEYSDFGGPARVLGPVVGASDDTSYSYDASGRLTSRVDAAGTTSFGYDTRDRLNTATDPLTGVTLSYTWGGDDRLNRVDYSSGPRQTFSYDSFGRLFEDKLWSSSAETTLRYSTAYLYDANGNNTSKTVGPAGVAGVGTHAYEYDRADRLTNWTAPGGTHTPYAYDQAGNRTLEGAMHAKYDERNRLCYESTAGTANACGNTPSGGTAYVWSPRGTLTSAAGANATFDAFGRTITAGGAAYTYDAYDRVAARGGVNFVYEGTGMDPIFDGTHTISHRAGGGVFGHKTGTTARLGLANQHGDLVGFVSGTNVTESFNYTPYGEPAGQTGTIDPNVGYQSDYTDPSTGQVWMGARWYQPTIGGFTSRDSYGGDARTPVSLNRYTYANNNPARYWDPTGYCAEGTSACPIGKALCEAGFDLGPFVTCNTASGEPISTLPSGTTAREACAVLRKLGDVPACDGIAELTINEFAGSDDSMPEPTPTFDCLVGCDNAQLNSLEEVKDWLENDPTGQFVFAVIDGCNRGDASKIDGNWSTHDVRCAATGETEDDGHQDVRNLIGDMIDESCQAKYDEQVCGANKQSIVDFVGQLTNDIGDFFYQEDNFEDELWEDIDHETTWLERHGDALSLALGIASLVALAFCPASGGAGCVVAASLSVAATGVDVASAWNTCYGNGARDRCSDDVTELGLTAASAGTARAFRTAGKISVKAAARLDVVLPEWVKLSFGAYDELAYDVPSIDEFEDAGYQRPPATVAGPPTPSTPEPAFPCTTLSNFGFGC